MKKRILLVAMQNDIVHSVPITLRLAGHNVETARCGLDAIKQARTLMPDLILVDSILPDMDGATVVDILRRLPSTCDLRTMLFSEKEHAALSSSDILAQVTIAIALCQELPPAELES